MRLVLWCSAIALLVGLLGCNDAFDGSLAATGEVRVSVPWPSEDAAARFIPYTTAKIVVHALQQGVDVGTIVLMRNPGETSATGYIKNVRAVETSLIGEAYDSNNHLLSMGEVTVTVPSGKTVSAELVLKSLRYVFERKFAEKGTDDGKTEMPSDVAIDSTGLVYVCDFSNGRIQVFTDQGAFVRKWAVYGKPQGIAIDKEDNVYITDQLKHCVTKFDKVGNPLMEFGSFGEESGQFQAPYGVEVDDDGLIYVADTGNHRIQVFMKDGRYLRKFGTFGMGRKEFKAPTNVAVDSRKYLYVADCNNHRIQVFDASSHFVCEWGSLGEGDGQFKSVEDVEILLDYYVLVTDHMGCRVQIFTRDGQYLEQFGGAGTADGLFGCAHGFGIAHDGTVYVADFSGNRVQKFIQVESDKAPRAARPFAEPGAATYMPVAADRNFSDRHYVVGDAPSGPCHFRLAIPR